MISTINNTQNARPTMNTNSNIIYPNPTLDTSLLCPVTHKDEKFANIAMEEAKKSTLLSQHGCVAVHDGHVIARGHNHYQCNSRDGFLKNTCSCHAEIDVLRKLYKLCIRKENSKSSKSKSSRPRSPPRETADVNGSFQPHLETLCFQPKKHQLICGT